MEQNYQSTTYFSTPYEAPKKRGFKAGFSNFTSGLKRKPKMPGKKLFGLFLIVALLVGGFFIARSFMTKGQVAGVSDDRVQVQEAKASQNINREFSFPLKDEKGEKVSDIKFTVENAELRDEIIVKGQKATAIQGRTFLIVNLKLANNYDKPIEINTRDYVRLMVGGNEAELMAADIHNDPVSVQPISTKSTRIGFPISDTDTNLVLKVGEIKGEKTDLEIKF